MATRVQLLFLLVIASVAIGGVVSDINRNNFGKKFVFGTASSAYQYEGAYQADDKMPSNWDVYSNKFPERIIDRSNGNVAVDQYHRYKEDVGLLRDIGFDAYRFSLSWSRIMTYGPSNTIVNQKGIRHYNNVINELITNGIQPFVTLNHFDVPQQLEDKYGGFLSKSIVPDFKDYADICFKAFGDRVRHWITINEPDTFAANGYNSGAFAPGHCSKHVGNCTTGNSKTEPYLVSHNMILAHAEAVNVYRKKYQVKQKGEIGITLSTYWFENYSDHDDDVKAMHRSQDFMFGWYLEPITFGDYPKSMKQLARNRLPRFTNEEKEMIKGTYDFLGLNYYTAIYSKNQQYTINILASYGTDNHVNLTATRDGIPIGPPEAPAWMYVYPEGFEKLLMYVKDKYNNPPTYITENGIAQNYEKVVLLEDILNDTIRVNYHNQHLQYLLKGIEDHKVDVRGYFAWSLLDNYEWADGYKMGFGINYVDLKTLKRYPKKSYGWFKKFLLH